MSNFIKTWGSLIKRLIGINTIFSGRATKLAGINDYNVFSDETLITFTAPDKITFSNSVPPFLRELSGSGKVFKVTVGGGLNNGSVFRMAGISGNTITVSNTVVRDYIGPATLDGRIWVVINDPMIARATSTGSTMYNVHNRDKSVIGQDASEVAFVFAEHYHDEPKEPEPVDELLFHQYNEVSERSLITSSVTGAILDIGPLAVVDNCGNVVRIPIASSNPVDQCYPYPDRCTGQTCKVDL
jgi:hypothetical protein